MVCGVGADAVKVAKRRIREERTEKEVERCIVIGKGGLAAGCGRRRRRDTCDR